MRSYSNNFLVQVYFLFFKFKIEKKRIKKIKTKHKKIITKKCEIKSKETTISKKKKKKHGLKLDKQTIIMHNEELSFNIKVNNESNLLGF